MGILEKDGSVCNHSYVQIKSCSHKQYLYEQENTHLNSKVFQNDGRSWDRQEVCKPSFENNEEVGN